MDLTDAQVQARFRVICDLYDLGMSIQREKIRQANPGLSEADVGRRLLGWLGHDGDVESDDPNFVARPPRAIVTRP